MEITDREDLGANLFAPTTDSAGRETPSYSLVSYVQPGDVVFHWWSRNKSSSAIVAMSKATGASVHSTITWSAHGTYSKGERTSPAFLVPLGYFTLLETPITLSDLRDRENQLRTVAADLKAAVSGSIYFPWAFSEKRPLRTGQGYLLKLPAAAVPILLQGQPPGANSMAQSIGVPTRTSFKDSGTNPASQFDSEDSNPISKTDWLRLTELEGDLDTLGVGLHRKEQRYLRRLLFVGSHRHHCALCGRILSREFLIAAHIKKRSQCSAIERKDAKNIVMAACVFGCDSLFEAGWIGVDSTGRIRTFSANQTDVDRILDNLEGRDCPAHNPSSAGYFKWHFENTFRGV